MTPTLSSAERSAETLSVWQEQWNLISDYWSDPLKGLSSFYEEVSDVPAVMATYQDFAAQYGFAGEMVEAAALSGVTWGSG